MTPHGAARIPGIGWWAYDPEEGRVQWDEIACAIHGHHGSPELSLDESAAFIHPEDRARWLEAATKAVEPGGSGRCEIVQRIVRDGRIRWVRVFGRREESRDASSRRLAGFVEDVTESVQAAPSAGYRLATELEATYRTAPVGMCVIDTDLRFTRINDRLAEIHGVSVEEHLGRHVSEVVPDLAEQAERLLRQVLETGEPVLDAVVRGETARDPGVGRVWLESWHPLRSREGDIIGVHVVAEEVTDQHGAAEERERLTGELEARARELAMSEARLRRIVESDMIGVLFWEIGGTVTFANDAFLHLLGYSRGDLEGGRIDWRRLTPPGWEEVDARAVEQLRERGVSEPFEKEYLHRDGTPVPVLLSAAAFEGRRDTGVTLVVDLTERKQAEAAAQEEALLRRLAMDAAELGTWHLELETQQWHFDQRARQIFGHTAAVLDAREAADAIHAEDRARSDRAAARALDPNGSGRYEIRKRVVTAAGEIRHVFLKGTVQRREGRPYRLVGTVRDETERVRADEALREGEEKFRATFEQAAVGMVMASPDGTLLRANRRLADLLGCTTEELEGRSVRDFSDPDDYAADRVQLRRLAAGEIERYDRDKQYVCPDGSTLWAHVTVSLVRQRDGSPNYFLAVIEDISKRKAAEASLRQAERHLRSVLDSLFTFVAVTTPDGVLVEANRAALEAAALSTEDVIGRPIHETYWWSYDEAVQARLRDAIERASAGQVSRYDVVVRLGPDHFEPIDFMIVPLRNEAGTVTHLVPSAMIITERVEVEGALRESETRLRAALSAARMGTWDIDLATGVVQRSDSTDRIFGLEPGGGVRSADDYFTRIHPDDVPAVESAIQRSVESGGEHRVEYRIVLPDGGERHISSRGNVVVDGKGVARRLIGALVDVTAHRTAEEARRETEERFRTLADRIPQLAWMANAEGAVFWSNTRWLEYTGTEISGAAAWEWTRACHPDHLERVLERLREARETGTPWEDTFPLRSEGGEYRWFLSRAVPITDDRGGVTRWLGTHTDVTEQLEAAAERERLLARAEVANQAKAEFMAVMSHELRTPLNAVVGYADLLDAGIPDPLPAGAAEQVRKIRLAANHQRELIDDILTFVRLDAGREAFDPEPFRTTDLVDEILAVISPSVKAKELGLVVDIGAAPDRLVSDPRKLRQILLNLLGNAIKFTDQGEVRLSVRKDGADRVTFEVVDTGPGIDPEDLGHLFEPFWQGDRSLTRTVEGTGLGLSIASRFTRILGGEIGVRSEPGTGSAFSVTVPARIDARPS